MFKAVMPNSHNKVLLKKSLRVMYEGLDTARSIKCPQKNRHLLGNERTQRRKEKVYTTSTSEMTGTLLNLTYLSTKYLDQILRFLTREFLERKAICCSVALDKSRHEKMSRTGPWKMCTEKARSGPRTVCIGGWSLATYRGQRCSPSNSGRDWTCKDTSLIIRRILGLDSGAWRLSLERGPWIRCVNN